VDVRRGEVVEAEPDRLMILGLGGGRGGPGLRRRLHQGRALGDLGAEEGGETR
jgi:hypothetical protein